MPRALLGPPLGVRVFVVRYFGSATAAHIVVYPNSVSARLGKSVGVCHGWDERSAEIPCTCFTPHARRFLPAYGFCR
jgi:hypothetical protein